MAYTEFFIQSTGSDLNAGSTTDNAAAFTYAGGTFVRATGVFTVASGDPAADGVTVGTYASVYTTAGAVAATFVAQITARDATTITVDVATLKWGVATSVSEGAGATTLKVSGAWASEIVLAATGLGTFTVPVSTRVNIKQATYTVAASRTVSIAGATTTPVWFRGYNTTPGDCDSDPSLTRPTLAFNATFVGTTSGAHQTWSSVNVTGNRSGTVWNVNQTPQVFVRCRFENTSSNAAAVAFTVANGMPGHAAYCWFKCPTTATTTGVVSNVAIGHTFTGCVFDGGGLAGVNTTTQRCQLVQCIGLNNTGSFVLATTATVLAFACTSYNSTLSAFKWSSTPATVPSCVVGCAVWVSGAYGIENASGTNTNNVFRACNDFYSCTSGQENGFGDSPAWFPQSEASQPYTSATDMTPLAGSEALDNGFAPGGFEAQTFSTFAAIGAVQPQSSGGGFVGIIGG